MDLIVRANTNHDQKPTLHTHRDFRSRPVPAHVPAHYQVLLNNEATPARQPHPMGTFGRVCQFLLYPEHRTTTCSMSLPRRLPDRETSPDIPPETTDQSRPTDERILHLIHETDGPLWQRDIVDALDVSKATISRNLASLERDNRIKRLEFRGQKLVALPDATIQLL